MIDPVSSIFSYIMSRSNAAMSIAKSRMEAEAAMAQTIMEAAQNIQRITEGSQGPSAASSLTGSNIDIYI